MYSLRSSFNRIPKLSNIPNFDNFVSNCIFKKFSERSSINDLIKRFTYSGGLGIYMYQCNNFCLNIQFNYLTLDLWKNLLNQICYKISYSLILTDDLTYFLRQITNIKTFIFLSNFVRGTLFILNFVCIICFCQNAYRIHFYSLRYDT